jgi:hypothetical protein
MEWIKRNLFLVLGGVVALALLGVAGFYLMTKIQQDRTVTGELDTATQRLEALARRDPHPNPENIVMAQEEGNRLRGFLGEVEKYFEPAPYPEGLNNMVFRTFLDNSRAQLLADAQKAGVEVPTNYWFTFAAQKGAVNFSPGTLEPLASQLADIRVMCDVLFDAKVNSLVWLKRPQMDTQDSLGTQDYLASKPVTNEWAVITPYEVAFQGFSAQLASVLEGLARLPHCFVVTNIVIEPEATAGSQTDSTGMPDYMSRYAQPGAAVDIQQQLQQRYGRYGGGRGRTPMVAPVPIQPPPTRVQRGPATVLDEKPLRFTLSIQSVKLKPQPQTQQPQIQQARLDQ